MARIKNKVARYAVYLNQLQDDALKALMLSAMADTPSQYIGGLIAKEWERRSAPRGRPKGTTKAHTATDREETEPDDDIRDIPHPDDFGHPGEFMTATEYAGYCALKGLDPTTGLSL